MSKKFVPSMVKDQQLIKKRREQIIKGAVRLFIAKGFHRTTTREIAKESGFSIGTLYEYIGTKEDVLYLVCDAIYDEVTERVRTQLHTTGTALERLITAIRAYFAVVDDMQEEVLVMYQETKSLPKETLPYVLKKELEMVEIMTELIAECVSEGGLAISENESRQLSHNILVMGQMWTFRRWAVQKGQSIEAYTNQQIKQLLGAYLVKR
ncbi:TetR/AcrR family transcriptional regulator [Alkalihalobacillus clausii]|jgi:TetR/AcrR family transcriptional regulator, cholesterol catabolism regulator|uniref:TetR/AcrR family transcriptional regulator n=1 Tax=Shouchella clausii TaxID=79880 RepID=UPI0020420367|nr:TetR/AcrR family transcriptional regulator [Shouchella clausii]MCM3548027.1 TetR/AcrR family transcriptional regulator [Shouchella clausii]